MVSRSALVMVALLLLAASPMLAGAEGRRVAGVVSIAFIEPVDGGVGWRVNASVLGVNCSGVVRVNPAYLQARALSGELVVLPPYYVLVSICPSGVVGGVVSRLERLNDSILFVVRAPPGFVVRSGLDWRGYGFGGVYRVPGWMLARYYLYDGVVVASRESYAVVDNGTVGFSLVYYRGFRGDPGVLVSAVVAVRDRVSGWLGSSPRSPVVGVLVSPRGFLLLAPGTGYSLGGVFVVVDSLAHNDPGWRVHVFAHEVVHGWINDGLVYGDFSFAEAVVELLAVRGLREEAPRLYRLASRYTGEGVDAGEPYAVWLRVHALLWRLSLDYCGFDAYTAAVRSIFNESLSSGSVRIYSVLDLARRVAGECGSRGSLLLCAWGRLLPRAPGLDVDGVLSGSLNLSLGRGCGCDCGRPAPPTASPPVSAARAPTSTVTVTVTRTVEPAAAGRVSSPSSAVASSSRAGGSGGLGAVAVAAVVAGFAAGLLVGRRGLGLI